MKYLGLLFITTGGAISVSYFWDWMPFLAVNLATFGMGLYALSLE